MSVRLHIAVIVVVSLSLLGLVWIQYHLLSAGLVLEKKKLDKQIAAALEEVSEELDRRQLLRGQIIDLYRKQGSRLSMPEYRLPDMARDSLDRILDIAMRRNAIGAEYSFGVFAPFAAIPFLKSPDFNAQTNRYEQYKVVLQGSWLEECHCELTLQVNIHQSFQYLLRQMGLQIAFSIAFVMLLAASMLFLLSQLRKLRFLDEAKNEFINNLTHELKTPLFSIKLLTGLLRKSTAEGDAPKSTALLDLTEQETAKLQTHVEKVLELASLEHGNYQLSKKQVDTPAMLAELAATYAAAAEAIGGSLIAEWPPSLPGIFADEVHLRNALSNLLDNALKYGGEKPRISLLASPQNGCLRVEVRDEGPGIPPQYQSRLFDKFYRVPQGDAPRVKGFGLGLSYVRQIAIAHGGSVEMHSISPRGSAFVFSVPTGRVGEGERERGREN
ncbi:MAG: HAMP domain-containing histidine kinase [Saprospiraceae bacterium]|jgi:two-component system phosphate regulon sensor histidine kinase PhoR|nr:HAMP domain-containing histidine kinase [Saprospiraceae bacterium]